LLFEFSPHPSCPKPESIRVTSLIDLVQRNLNPFDPATFKPGNFWQDALDPALDVSSIHRDTLKQIGQSLKQVQTDRRTRTLVLVGDSGSGKSHLLAQLKRQLNHQAVFAYIGPWPSHDYLWRHVLRQTVDSLVNPPEGQTDSQLLLWLKGLPSLQERSLIKWVQGERRRFISDLRASFPVGIYRAKEFFGVLYDLMNPELRPLGYDWLRGENLDAEDCQLLKVQGSILAEDDAQKLLLNFGRIAQSTQPIVLCFDNLDNIPKLANGQGADLQPLFDFNSTLHNEKLDNFLVLISMITSTWKQGKQRVQPADLARIDKGLPLKQISLKQAAAIWACRLAPIHAQASSPPEVAIAPLTPEHLAQAFPGGRALPRHVLKLGQGLIQHVKTHGEAPPIQSPPTPGTQPNSGASRPQPEPPRQDDFAQFQLIWQKTFKTAEQRLNRLGQLSSQELIWRLQEALEALEAGKIQQRCLPSPTFGDRSLAYGQPKKTGVIWTEDGNMTSFCHIMKACQKLVDQGTCDRIVLIRHGSLGKPKTKGNQLFRQIFSSDNTQHLVPSLQDVVYLEAYHSLVNAAAGGELVVGTQNPTVAQLQELARKTKVLTACDLLKQLGLVNPAIANVPAKSVSPTLPRPNQPADSKLDVASKKVLVEELKAAKQHILSLVISNQVIGIQHMIGAVQEQWPQLATPALEDLVQQLCQEGHLTLLDSNAKPEGQLVCWIPSH
jgi:energy-coupling factor transporter ATP-binding protein EcfA2